MDRAATNPAVRSLSTSLIELSPPRTVHEMQPAVLQRYLDRPWNRARVWNASWQSPGPPLHPEDGAGIRKPVVYRAT